MVLLPLGDGSQICLLFAPTSEHALFAVGMAYPSISTCFCDDAATPLVGAAHGAHVTGTKGERRRYMDGPNMSRWTGSI